MPYYSSLKYDFKDHAKRTSVIENLQRLQNHLDNEIPEKNTENDLLLATWNIRDFGKTNRRGFGKRLKETHYYIAEILSRFDIIAVQEVNELDELERVLRILGSSWDYIATDVGDRGLGANGERMTFVFDKRKVWFKNVAGEIVLPSKYLISKAELEIDGKKVIAGKQFRRTPFIVSFQSNWFKFNLCTVHIYYGTASGPKLEERRQEIEAVAQYLAKRAKEELKINNKATIILGDFNIVHPEHKTMEALIGNDFVVPKALLEPTNLNRDKYYDQIAFICDPKIIDHLDNPPKSHTNSGILDIHKSVFRESDFKNYEIDLKNSKNSREYDGDNNLKKYYKTWKTYQMSDHMLMWVCLPTNNSKDYLDYLKEEIQ